MHFLATVRSSLSLYEMISEEVQYAFFIARTHHTFLDSIQILCVSSFFIQQQTIPCIDDRSRSSYMAVTNTKGIAAMTHSNRCISLIDTGTMKRIAEIDGLTRTVWTLCFHPHDPNLLATGDLGGTVCVFYGTVCVLLNAPEFFFYSQTIFSNHIQIIQFYHRRQRSNRDWMIAIPSHRSVFMQRNRWSSIQLTIESSYGIMRQMSKLPISLQWKSHVSSKCAFARNAIRSITFVNLVFFSYRLQICKIQFHQWHAHHWHPTWKPNFIVWHQWWTGRKPRNPIDIMFIVFRSFAALPQFNHWQHWSE